MCSMTGTAASSCALGEFALETMVAKTGGSKVTSVLADGQAFADRTPRHLGSLQDFWTTVFVKGVFRPGLLNSRFNI